MTEPKTIDEQLEQMKRAATLLRDLCRAEIDRPETILVEAQIAATIGVADRLYALADVAMTCAHLDEDKKRALVHGEALLKQWRESGGLQWLDGPRVEAALVHFNFNRH